MTEQQARASEELVLKTVVPMYVQMWLLPWHELENSLVHKCFTLKFIDEAGHCAVLSRATGNGPGGGAQVVRFLWWSHQDTEGRAVRGIACPPPHSSEDHTASFEK